MQPSFHLPAEMRQLLQVDNYCFYNGSLIDLQETEICLYGMHLPGFTLELLSYTYLFRGGVEHGGHHRYINCACF